MAETEVITHALVHTIRKEIEEQFRRGKASTARKLAFCARKVEQYLDGNDIPLSEIDAAWVDGFSSWIVEKEGLSENTRATYLRVIYTVCRTAANKGAIVDTTAFRTAEMSNRESVRALLTPQEIRKLIELDLESQPVFEKARAMWLFSFLCGGLSMTDMMSITTRMLASQVLTLPGQSIPVIDAAEAVADRYFDTANRYIFHAGNSQLTTEETTARANRLNSTLSLIAEKARLEKPLSIDNTRATWLNAARLRPNRFDQLLSDPQLLTTALQDVASSVDHNRKYWFAMRCLKQSVAEIRAELTDRVPGTSVFVAETDTYANTPTGVKKTRGPLLRDILFFHTTLSNAECIKKEFHNVAYTYDYKHDDTRRLATIPEREMKMFMYINSVPSKEIACFFPEETSAPAYQKGNEVIVTDGEWKGARGTYIGPSTRFPLHIIVAVTLANLNITVSAHIPHHFVNLL